MKALVDKDGTLTGFTSEDVDGIDVPDDCDLEPLKYTWDGRSFNPIMSEFNSLGPAPDFKDAVIKMLCSLHNGKNPPKAVLAWLQSEEKALKLAGKW